MDRDEPHNVLSYTIDYVNSPDLNNFFAINILTGVLEVKLLNDALLDYDEGTKDHDVKIIIEDNYLGSGARFQAVTSVMVHLKDVNDHAPTFKPMTLTISEEAVVGGTASAPICAEDKDSGDNGRVSYEIESIVAGN